MTPPVEDDVTEIITPVEDSMADFRRRGPLKWVSDEAIAIALIILMMIAAMVFLHFAAGVP